jgi:hypothetical protein
MFTKDFWTAENELAYRVTNHDIPSPVSGGFLVNPEPETDDIDLSAFESPATGRKPTIDGFDPIGSDDEIDLSAFAE